MHGRAPTIESCMGERWLDFRLFEFGMPTLISNAICVTHCVVSFVAMEALIVLYSCACTPF